MPDLPPLEQDDAARMLGQRDILIEQQSMEIKRLRALIEKMAPQTSAPEQGETRPTE